MTRPPGLSVRWQLTLSYVAVVMVTGGLLLAIVYVFLLRYVPVHAYVGPEGLIPGRTDLLRAFLPPAAWMLAALLAASTLGGWLLAGRVLAPLTQIARATRQAAGGSLGHRIAMPGRHDEFRELADSFDGMLAQLESQLAEQQRFAANASHELRTPLAITQALIDVAADDPTSDRSAMLRRLREVNARAIHLTEALLVLSRADQRAFTTEPVDLSLLAEEAAETLLPIAEQRGISLEVRGDTAITPGSSALLRQLVTNLVQNAVAHNAAHEGWVTVSTARDADAVELTIENPGERIAAEVLSTLVEPFQRGTSRVRDGRDGHGLGLAIARSIVRAHHGELQLSARDAGGLLVRVSLPVAS